MSQYVHLQLGLSTQNRSKWLIALRSTADYYGWTEAFPAWEPQGGYTSGGRRFFSDPGRRGGLQMRGGNRHRVCRSRSTAGTPAGMTNAFRLSTSCAVIDIAELAHFTEGEWFWMTGLHGERVSRERWEAIYQSGNSRAKGGLVSV